MHVVIDRQRRALHARRQAILEGRVDVLARVRRVARDAVAVAVAEPADARAAGGDATAAARTELVALAGRHTPGGAAALAGVAEAAGGSPGAVAAALVAAMVVAWDARDADLAATCGPAYLPELADLGDLRDGIERQGFGPRDPLAEWRVATARRLADLAARIDQRLANAFEAARFERRPVPA